MVRLHVLKRLPRWRGLAGQGLVEFGIAGMVFFVIIFGMLDIGRAVFQYSQIENAVREGGRVAKVKPCQTALIQNAVVYLSDADSQTQQGGAELYGLAPGDIGVSATSCSTPGSVTVTAPYEYTPIVGGLLGISPITTTISTTVEIE